MNEDAILAQLRDIHLPAELNTPSTLELAAWPFVGLALVVAAIWVARRWIRNQWRRNARSDLSRILSISDQTTQWSTLLAFADGLRSRSGRSITLPNAAFVRPEAVTDEQRTEFIAYLHAELRR